MFKTLVAAFYFIFFFNNRFIWALINRSGAIFRHRYFQGVIGPLNRGSIPKKQHFIIIFLNFSLNRALFSCSGTMV